MKEILLGDAYIRKLDEVGDHKTTVMGVEFDVARGVFSPEYSLCSHLLAQWTSIAPGESVLDVGTGCGVQAILAARRGAGYVVATDINHEALRNAERNAKKHNVTINTFPDLVFAALIDKSGRGVFDVVVANLPFGGGEAKTSLEQALNDPDYKATREFVFRAPDLLLQKGRAYMVFSDIGDINWLEQRLAEDTRLYTRVLHEELAAGHVWKVYCLTRKER